MLINLRQPVLPHHGERQRVVEFGFPAAFQHLLQAAFQLGEHDALLGVVGKKEGFQQCPQPRDPGGGIGGLAEALPGGFELL